MPVQRTNSIDILALDHATDTVVMTMHEPRPWDGSDQRLFELQEKVNAYLSFALDGEMLHALPQLEGKKLRLQLDCIETPDEATTQFVEVVRQQIGFQEIEFAVRVVPDLQVMEEHGCCGGQGHDHAHSHAGGCCGGGHGHSHGGGHDHAHAHDSSHSCGGGGCGCA
jgi:hypothetical protein